MRKTLTTLILFVTALALVVPAAWADVPTNMNVQGRLTDSTGAPVGPGAWQFTFRIFDMEVGGTQIWPANGVNGEAQIIVMGDDGLWTTAVGEDTALTDVVFQDTTRWLEVTVTNFIDPGEIMPRMKLNTNPYSYRAATAQQTDRIGGLDLGDLLDQFVDVPGDTMSGILTVNAPNKAGAGSSFRTNNISDANSPTALFPNTIGVIGEAASDGTEGKWGVIGYGKGADGISVGVYGEGKGAGNTAVGVYGSAFGGNATENFSGLFEGGDVLVQFPKTPGDSAVRLPANSIAAPEILDEPGIATNLVNPGLSLGPSPMQDLVTVTITIPGPGYIVLHGKVGEFDFSGTTNSNIAFMQIDETAGGGLDGLNYTTVGHFAYPSTALMPFHPTADRVYFKSSAGTYTFRLEAYKAGAGGTATVFLARLNAMYFPTSYGSVLTTMSGQDRGQFQNVASVSAATPAMDAPVGDVGSVDLRELELRVARANAAAERAKREWLEAQGAAGLQRGPNGLGSPRQGDQ